MDETKARRITGATAQCFDKFGRLVDKKHHLVIPIQYMEGREPKQKMEGREDDSGHRTESQS